jgi:ribonucleoside-diphosphate reductase alpha chain
VGEQEGYVTVGLFADGHPGEVFITISKEGSTIRGLMDSVAVLTSLALQYGVPLEDLVRKFRGVHFEPAGFTDNPEVPQAKSIVDYIFRWLSEAVPVCAASAGTGVQGGKDGKSRAEGVSSGSRRKGYPNVIPGCLGLEGSRR